MEHRYLSPSSISLLLYSPSKWYAKYIEKQQEEEYETEAKIIGSLVHCLLLNPLSFDHYFAISSGELPTENVKKVVDKVFETSISTSDERTLLSEYDVDILNACAEIGYNQHLKTDKQRVEAVLKNGASYFESLRLIHGKTLVSQQQLEFAQQAATRLRDHPKVYHMLGFDSTNDVYFETEEQYDYNSYFGLKGILDNFNVDHTEKIIYVNDLKTMFSKKLSTFMESVEFWKYDRQLAVYSYIIFKRYADLLERGYKLQASFIVIDKDYEICIFRVSEETLLRWLEELKSTLNIVTWHFESQRFDLPYEFRDGIREI